MSKILVTGANGQLGSEIKDIAHQFSEYQFYFTNKELLNISSVEAVEKYCIEKKIQTIINCAAYTNVEKAENEPELCDLVNHFSTKNLSLIAKKQNIKLVHISTDYVFNGKKETPYTENDKTSPLNIYGNTKDQGEKAIQAVNPKNSIIIRTSWVYSSYGNNFVKSMLRLAENRKELNIVADQIGSPTYAADLAKTILQILPKIDNNNVEIYHFSNEGNCSWADFAIEIFYQTKTDCKVHPIATSEYPTKAERPLHSVLDTSKIKNTFGIEIPDWKTSLKSCLNKL